jgi:tetratricopeptide (TPR) repeat protein
LDKHHLVCRYCGESIPRKRLKSHIKKLHAGIRARGIISESQLLKTMQVLKHNPKKGFELLKKLELTYPANADICYNLGVALLRQDRLEEAQEYFEKTLKIDEDIEYAKDNLDFTKRVREILAKECTGKDLEEMGALLISATDTGFFDLATRIGNLMVDIDKGPGALNDLGLTFQHQQKIDKAIECYDKALRINPNMPNAISNKAFCLMITNRLNEAYSLYKRLIVLKPEFLQGWYHMGIINIEKKEYEEALPYLDKAIELNDHYYLAYVAKYEALRNLKRTDEANLCWDKAVELNPDYAMQLALGKTNEVHMSHMHSKTNTPFKT